LTKSPVGAKTDKAIAIFAAERAPLVAADRGLTMQTPWHFTTWLDLLDHWQTLATGLIAIVAAVLAVGGPEFFARRRARRELIAIRASLAVEIRAFLRVLIDVCQITRTSMSEGRIVSSPILLLATELPKPIVYPAIADRLALLGTSLAASVTAFFTDLDRLAAALKVVAERPQGVGPMEDTAAVAERFQQVRHSSLELLSKLPPDDSDADLRSKIEAIGRPQDRT
jgi:hypothetical protein